MAHKIQGANNCGCGAECEIGPPTRNNYFTGKLLVERDFVDEQTYHRDKMRGHEKYLHGAGVVCGLKVVQYANSSCRDRYVSVEPGIAIDCCGNEIIVPELDYFDITQTTAYASLSSSSSTDPVDVQICVKYRECCIEDIPILYDDCSCDGIQTAPNRILESYAFDLVLAPKLSGSHINSPIVKWCDTIGVAQPVAFAFNTSTNLGYVATTGGDLVRVSLDNHSTLSSYNLPAAALAVAVSNDGSRVYAAVPNADATKPPQLLVLDTGDLAAGPSWTLAFPAASAGGITLAVAPSPDDRLIGVMETVGAYAVWATDINNPTGGTTPANAVQVAVNLPTGAPILGLAFANDAKTGYSVVSGQPSAVVLDLTATPTPTVSVVTASPPATANPTLVAVLADQGANQLAVATSTGTVALVNPTNPPTSPGSVTFSAAPIALMVSPDSRWIYALQPAGTAVTDFYALNVADLRANTLTLPQPIQIQRAITSAQINGSGDTIFALWPGSSTDKTSGGILILNVADSKCELDERCPHCESLDCIVLATVKNYMIGFQILDPAPAPAPSSSADEAAKIARINNKLGRVVLPSVQALGEYLDCKIDHIQGTPGPQEPAGPAGKDGTNGINGTNGTNGINGTNGTDGTNGTNGTDGTNGTNGTDGLGLLANPTTINALSWTHNGDGNLVDIIDWPSPEGGTQQGFVIHFSNDIDMTKSGIAVAASNTSTAVWNLPQPHVFEVFVPSGTPNAGTPFVCRCSLLGVLVPVTAKAGTKPGTISEAKYLNLSTATKKQTSALAFVPTTASLKWITGSQILPQYGYTITVRGDFLVDTVGSGRAVDARFLYGVMPRTGSPPGIEGGIFESWFALKSATKAQVLEADGQLNINQATAPELVGAGFTQGVAKRIVDMRKNQPFASIEDFSQRLKLTPEQISAMKLNITVG